MAKYRVPVLENYIYQPTVKDKDLRTPPVSPVKGDRYLLYWKDGQPFTGVWVGMDNQITWFDGTDWKFDAPKPGMITYIEDEKEFYYFNSPSWKKLVEELGLGDMLKSVYDTDNDGIVDNAAKAVTVDDGVGNSSSAADIKDAVDTKHEHANKSTLDAIEEAFTAALKVSYDDAVAKAHVSNTDTILDEGGTNEVAVADIKGAVTDRHTHSNKSILDAVDVAFTTTLKSNYDSAYAKRAQYDADLGMILFDI